MVLSPNFVLDLIILGKNHMDLIVFEGGKALTVLLGTIWYNCWQRGPLSSIVDQSRQTHVDLMVLLAMVLTVEGDTEQVQRQAILKEGMRSEARYISSLLYFFESIKI